MPKRKMDFELSDELNNLLKAKHLDEAIKIAEDKLGELPFSGFHKILGKDLLHLIKDFTQYLESFYSEVKEKKVKSIYCEMNGFTINYECWFVDSFAYDHVGGLEDLDWLADFEDEGIAEEQFILTGFEDLQTVYKDFMENEKWKDPQLQKASGICEILIILRLQELVRQVMRNAKVDNLAWSSLPIFATAHDYDLLYREN